MKDGTKTAGKRRTIIGIIGYVIIFLIIVTLVLVIISKATNHTLFVFKRTTAWVMTSSMEPEIPAQSYILLRKADASEVKVGDVITFLSDDPELKEKNAYNTHRVIKIIGNNEEFVTKGDANQIEDAYTAKAGSILGIYEKNLPVMTAIGRFLFSGIGMMITLTAILVIIMAIYVPDIMRATKAREKEIEQKHREQIDMLVREEVERLKAENARANEQKAEEPAEPEEASEEIAEVSTETVGEPAETAEEPAEADDNEKQL